MNARRLLGLSLIFITVLVWVGSSLLIQWIFVDLDFDRPLFLTWLSTSLFSVYGIGFAVLPSWRSRNYAQFKTKHGQPFMPRRRVFRIAAGFCPVWVAANWCFNLSLDKTTVSSSTILSSTSSFWTFLLGLLLLKERFDWRRLLSVALCIAGCSLVAMSDESLGGKSSLLGDMLALSSAVFYAIYTIYLRKCIVDDSTVKMPMFFAFVGMVNTVALIPVLAFTHAVGLEKFSFPGATVWGFLVLNGLVGTVVSDLCWATSVLLTNPLVSTLGLSLTIPLAMAADALANQRKFAWFCYIGSALVVLAFLLVNYFGLRPGTESKPMDPCPNEEEELLVGSSTEISAGR